VSAIALLLAGLVLALSSSSAVAFAFSTRSRTGLVLAEGLLLISIGALRVFMGVAFGPLRRRRAFEPDRVGEAPRPSLGWPYLLIAGGALLWVVMLVPRLGLDFLDGNKHPAPSFAAYALWVAVVLIGFAAVAIAYVRNKDGTLKASALAAAWLDRLGRNGRDLISSGRQSSGCAFAGGRLRFGLVSDRGAFGSIAHLPGVSHYRAPRPGKPPRNQRAAMSHLTPRGLRRASARAVPASLAADAGCGLGRELHSLREDRLAAVLAVAVAAERQAVERPGQLILQRGPHIGDALRDLSVDHDLGQVALVAVGPKLGYQGQRRCARHRLGRELPKPRLACRDH